MSFIKDVWGGHDYIPEVWDEWLKDKEGKMFVVVVGGVPVGMNRLTFLDDGSAWFQGVRVHPDYRGRGLATMLGENSMRIARENGIRLFRLTTASRNYASRRQSARMEFKEVARFSIYEPPNRKFEDFGAEKVSSKDLDATMQLIRASKEFKLGSGVYWHNFGASSLTRGVVGSLVSEGSVRRLGEAVAVVKPGGEGKEVWEQVCFVGGPVKEAVQLVKSSVRRVKRAEARWVFVPKWSPIIPGLRNEGFRREFSQILFERKATNG